MAVTINVGFQRRDRTRRKVRYEWKNVTGMQLDVASFKEITYKMICQHPMCLPSKDGWSVQGWAQATPADTKRRVEVDKERSNEH